MLRETGFIPHGHCYLWQSNLVTLHIVGDSLTSLAYLSIPLLLLYFVRQRQDVPFKPVFFLFGAFIVSCGLTHVMEVWTLWHPIYWVSGLLKLATAGISLYTAFCLISIIPQALTLPSPSVLEALNTTLAAEIDERKQAERQVRELNQRLGKQVSELQQLSQLKDEFMSTVSHELRTPLTSMKIALTMLKLTQRDHKQERYLHILETEWQRELNLVNQLLDLQALESGSRMPRPSCIPVQHWLTQVIEPFYLRCEERQQTLCIECDPGLETFTTDADLLERVILELLTNACKYTPAHQTITLTVAPVPQGLAIQVINAGVTIPAADLSRIFDRFHRVAGLDVFNQGGTGLGLTIVQNVVQLLGGTITVTSVADVTTFTLILPPLLTNGGVAAAVPVA